jgi:hypothetical protein
MSAVANPTTAAVLLMRAEITVGLIEVRQQSSPASASNARRTDASVATRGTP